MLSELLGQAIQEPHRRVEELPFFKALPAGLLPLESYVGQLRAMAVLHGTLERELQELGDGAIRAFLAGRPSRLVHVRQDLGALDSLSVPDIPAALPPVTQLAAWIRLLRVDRPTDLLGVMYVLEGTTLGNTQHLPEVLRAFGERDSGIAHYYAGYGPETVRRWRDFCAFLDHFPLDGEGRARVVRTALDCFRPLEALFSALYPVGDAQRVFTARMLNPEAGDHAVPADLREIRAAVAAAEKCREAFPYFDERFRERGQAFAHSDSAWLATLAQLPEAQALSQVEWLGQVLGNRGIPRITLERQLAWLHGDLVAALPEQVDRFRVLLEASRHLERERCRKIPETGFQALADAFQEATVGELGGRFKGTGALIVSAVCDRCNGITGAVSSLVPWLSDPARFPPAWIAAVSQTCQAAMAVAKGSP